METFANGAIPALEDVWVHHYGIEWKFKIMDTGICSTLQAFVDAAWHMVRIPPPERQHQPETQTVGRTVDMSHEPRTVVPEFAPFVACSCLFQLDVCSDNALLVEWATGRVGSDFAPTGPQSPAVEPFR